VPDVELKENLLKSRRDTAEKVFSALMVKCLSYRLMVTKLINVIHHVGRMLDMEFQESSMNER
jgi:hypothetical protein